MEKEEERVGGYAGQSKGEGGERRFNYITIVVGRGDNKNEN